MVKMLIFSFDYPPNTGGIARLNEAIVRGLVNRGVAVHVLTQQNSVQSVSEIDALVETKRLAQKRPRRELDAFLQLRRLHGHDLYLSGIWYPEGLLADLAGLRPHVILAYGAELFVPTQNWQHSLRAILMQRTLQRSDLVIADSRYAAGLVKSIAPSARVAAVPLAVDHKSFTPRDRAVARMRLQIAEGKRVLSTVARVHRFKGHETVLEALSKLSTTVREMFVYLVAGDGPDLEFLQARAQSLGVTDQVRWLGFVADEDLPSIYSATDLFILTTREIPEEQSVEGFGLVFLEAQACATPVVGTRTGGISDAVSPGDGGWLIAQDDVPALVEILKGLHEDPAYFRSMGQLARQRVEREFTWDHYLDRFVAALCAEGIVIGGA
ncbi:MAG: glycosyltransferase family 4 protein [Anaerolineae bacterium]|nr:glycosyltransferase family 4 protein [Anaerolineae bacterium]